MQRIDDLLSHVWMVRTFLKHSDEAQEEDDLAEIHRQLYEYMLSVGEPLKRGDADDYVRQAKKKLAKLRGATERFGQVQPEISTHTNFQMAARSLTRAVEGIVSVLAETTAQDANRADQPTTDD
jgi:hypothetical protein